MSKKYNPQDVVVLVIGKPAMGFELDSENCDEVEIKQPEQESDKENNV